MSYYNEQHTPVGVPPQQGYPKDAYPPPGHPVQGYPPQGYPPPQGYAPHQGYAAAPPPRKQTGMLEGWCLEILERLVKSSIFSGWWKDVSWLRSVVAAFSMLASDQDSGDKDEDRAFVNAACLASSKMAEL
ncbi:hypothetical protein SADUNF_Sadunf07G0004200 [Salix dunnii]|uniref:Rhodopsin n=1 Tax=Salix dunnii TaxID=1413687 RepID=A0A835MTC7_9ROSI|nr:hypothetical protein SADUNF_Sadunf07G0004200 [Salix dunnii]